MTTPDPAAEPTPQIYVYLPSPAGAEPDGRHPSLADALQRAVPREGAVLVRSLKPDVTVVTTTDIMALVLEGAWSLTLHGAAVLRAEPEVRRVGSYQEWLTGDPDRIPPVAAALALHDDVTVEALIPDRLRRRAASDWLVLDEASLGAGVGGFSFGLTSPSPRHGARRNHREVTDFGPTQELVGPGDQVIYRGATSSHTYTAEERYCGVCAGWVECGSIVQHICCKRCATSWTEAIEPGSVRRMVVPVDWTRPDGVTWPWRIDLHPASGGAVAHFTEPYSVGDAEILHHRFESLEALCATLHLDAGWVETLEPDAGGPRG